MDQEPQEASESAITTDFDELNSSNPERSRAIATQRRLESTQEAETMRRGFKERAAAKWKEMTSPKTAEKPTPEPAKPVVAATEAIPAPTSAPDVAKDLFEKVAAAVEAQKSAEAARVAADARAQRAEQLLKEMEELAVQDPHGFLQARKLDAEKFTARLLRGGELTAEEKAQKVVSDAQKSFDQRLKAIDQAHAEAEFSKNVALLKPALEKEFPLVAAEHGPDVALKHLLAERTRLGRNVTPQEAFAAEEKRIREHYTARAELVGMKAQVAEQAAAKPAKKTAEASSKTIPGTARKVREELDAAFNAKLSELRQLGRLA